MIQRRRALASLRTPLACGLIAISLAAALTGCGADAGPDVATEPSPTSPATSPVSAPAPTVPTQEPKPGGLPPFPYQDYSYTLGRTCFCANNDQRYRITVTDGAVSSMRWATEGPGHQIGDAVRTDYLRLTIQDVIDRGNDPEMAKVQVHWPAGQLYPHSVYLDQMANVADEEVTWLISDVEPA